MRIHSHTAADIEDAFQSWAPKLREYAMLCRLEHPLPARDSLSPAQHEQYRILLSVLREFRDNPINAQPGASYLEIYHGSPITLLAATDVLPAHSDSIVLLLSQERERWFKECFRGVGGWFESCWVTIHDQIPKPLAADFVDSCPSLGGLCYWVLTKARGGRATHEVWKWDEKTAVQTAITCEQLIEEGSIDNFDDFDLTGAI